MGILWPKSGFIERDNNDVRAGGAIANFYQGGTSTPLTVYSDAAEASPRTADVAADSNGRWPAVFIPFTTSYDVQVRTSGGTQLYYYTNIPNPDPVEASVDSVADEELLATGHVWWEPINATKVGAVRLNGRTIGNASSGATERANADTEDLYTFLWNNLANGQAAVSTGRGASAAADYAANKTIALLDLRRGTLFGVDDMGNTAAGGLTVAPFTNGAATTPGSIVGTNAHTLTTAELPAHLHAISITSGSGGSHTHTLSATTDAGGSHTHTITDPGHIHTYNKLAFSGGDFANGSGGQLIAGQDTSSAVTGISINASATHTHTLSGTTASDGAHTHAISGNTGNTGSGDSHNVMSHGALGTWFIKL